MSAAQKTLSQKGLYSGFGELRKDRQIFEFFLKIRPLEKVLDPHLIESINFLCVLFVAFLPILCMYTGVDLEFSRGGGGCFKKKS